MDISTGAIGSILSKLAELVKAEYKLQTGLKEQIKSLTLELESAHAFLQKIDKVPPDKLDEQVKIWANEVRESSYDMDDILDNFLVRVVGAKPIKKNKLERLQETMATFFSRTKARHNIANAIEEVNKKVKEIEDRRRRYKLDNCVVSPAAPSSTIDPRIAKVYNTQASLLVGIDERKAAIINMLSHDDGTPKKVVSLVGFGGVGKTTLAKATYDQLKPDYNYSAFVSVGQKPNLLKIFKEILFELDKNQFKEIHSTQRGADSLIPELLRFLGDKRYLIVIDDVWETESRNRIMDALTDNDIGSKIIITTRNLHVAIGRVYKVQPLSEDNSKKLFSKRIFGNEDMCPNNQQQNISEVADKILKKCGGIPLAIVTMASLLVGKSMEEWFEVCNSFGSNGKGQLDDTMWILSLSYYDLPSHLKTCLLYLSIFPEDHLISKDALIWLWVAEGFVNCNKPGAGLFEIGEGYFNELINRNLIQPVENSFSMIVEACRVHDMILDLIRFLSCEAKFATVIDNVEEMFTGSNARRLALQNKAVEDTPKGNWVDTTRARSMTAFGCSFVPQVVLGSFTYLRVLYLEYCKLHHDEHVEDLHHLRFLGIETRSVLGIETRSGVLKFCQEIGALKFLRVLYVQRFSSSKHVLPLSVGMLTQLVCLHARRSTLPSGIIKSLTSLQELHISIDWDDEESSSEFVKDLCNLCELRVLVVCTLTCCDEWQQYDLLVSVGNLHKLQHLGLGAFGVRSPRDEAMYNRGLSLGLDPSHLPNLSHLTLQLLFLSDQGLEILGGLPELSYLGLHTHGCATVTGTRARGYFKKLRFCCLRRSTVQFVVNEEGSSVSFTIWFAGGAPPGLGPKRKQDSCRVARAVMPNLEGLSFGVDNVGKMRECNNRICDNLGLDYLTSLQKVVVRFNVRSGGDADVVEKEKAALGRTIEAHANRPTLRML